MQLKIIFTSAIAMTTFLCHAQNTLNLNEKTQQFFNKPWEARPKIELQKLVHPFKQVYVLKPIADNMPILISDCSATQYFKSHTFLFNETPATVYYMPNALRKTLPFDPKATNKALIGN